MSRAASDEPRGVSVVCANPACRRILDVREVTRTDPETGESYTESVQPYRPEDIFAAARAQPGWRVVGRLCYCPACKVPALKAVG